MTDERDPILVADLMSTDLVTCSGDASLVDVALKFARSRVHAVFVLDPTGQPAGIVSDFDLLTYPWLGDDAAGLQAMRSMTAAELMTSPVETINRGTAAAGAADRLRQLHLSHLLVTDDGGKAVGVLSVSDLVKPFGKTSETGRTVRDVMSQAIVTCLPSTPLASVARAMNERRSRSIVVVDEAGRAIGVITDFDLLSLYQDDRSSHAVAELMRAPLITTGPDMSLSDAANLMIGKEVHRLVVVDPDDRSGAPVGLVSTSDIVAEMAQARLLSERSDI